MNLASLHVDVRRCPRSWSGWTHVYARAPALGLLARKSPLPSANLWVNALGNTSEETMQAATQISRAVEGRVLALYGREDIGVYVLAETRGGEIIRRLRYVRDDGGWLMTGTAQTWESDFHSVLSIGEAVVERPPPPRMAKLVE